MEAGEYDLPASGSHGECRKCGRADEYPDDCWTGTICTNPAMLYISVRPERYSYSMIKESGEFVVNLTTEELAKATDYCGVRSGRDVDKWKEMHLTRGKAKELSTRRLSRSVR